jgi:hypothetical protein
MVPQSGGTTLFPIVVGFAITCLVFGLLAWHLSRLRKGGPQRPERSSSSPDRFVGGQRLGSRCGKNSVRIFIRKGEEEKLGQGWIVDRSSGGLGLLLLDAENAWSTGPLAQGDVLEVKPTNIPMECPWARVEVRHIDQRGDYWLAGGRLLDELPAEAVAIFGYAPGQKTEKQVDVLERRNWTGPIRHQAAKSA